MGRQRLAYLQREIKKEKALLEKEKLKYHNKAMEKKALEFQKDLRDRATVAERKLAIVLANSPLYKKFEFQHIIYIKRRKYIERFFIADFCFPDRKLIIELDGEYHYTPEQIEKDKERTKILKAHGYTVLRTSNKKVLSTKSFDVLIDELTNKFKV